MILISGHNPVSAGHESVLPAERIGQTGPSPVEFRILGPLELLAGGRPVALGGPQQRALVAVLLLRANEPVSKDALIEELWGETPPASAGKVLQNHVLRVRRALEADPARPERLLTRSPGYLLRVAPDELDAHRFVALLDAARFQRSRDLAVAASTLREALALWRGPALGDVRNEALAASEIQRLEDLRLHAREELIDVELALDRHEVLVPELEALVAEHPFRERLHGLLILALYRSGRQQEALDAFGDLRTRMQQELGLEPSPELRRLQRSILDQDPALDVREAEEAAAPVRPAVAAPRRGERRRRRAFAFVLAGVALLALAAGAWQQLAPPGVIAAELPADVVARLDFRTSRADPVFRVGRTPAAVTVHEGAAWVANFGDRTVSRVDLESGSATTTGTGFASTTLAAGGDVVWAIGRSDGSVLRLDAATGQALSRTILKDGLADAVADRDGVWVTSTTAGTVTRIAARNGRHTVIAKRLAGPAGVTIAGDALWIAESFARRLTVLDRRTGRVVRRMSVALTPDEVASGAGAVWVTHPLDDLITRVDDDSGQTRMISVGRGPQAFAIDQRSVWVLNRADHSIHKLDARTASFQRAISLSDPNSSPEEYPGGTPAGIAVDRGGLWVTVQER